MLARLPYGVYALAAILYLAEARGSYAVAGLVDAAFGLGAAPVQRGEPHHHERRPGATVRGSAHTAVDHE